MRNQVREIARMYFSLTNWKAAKIKTRSIYTYIMYIYNNFSLRTYGRSSKQSKVDVILK